MNVIWTPVAWEDYLFWQETDEKMIERINRLVKECKRDPFKGIGKPEPLKGDFKGCWSRRIDDEHRFVYTISPAGLTVIQCRYHY